MALDPPAPGQIAKLIEPLAAGAKPAPAGEGHIHETVPKADQVSLAVPVHVGRQAGMALDPPAAGIVAELVRPLLDRSKAGAGGDRPIHPAIPKADHIGPAVAIDIRHHAGMALDPPAAGDIAKLID